MSNYPPAEIARGDQHYAQVEHDLDQLVAAYRSKPGDQNRVEALDFVTNLLACPHTDDGTALTPHEHAGTLANMLAIAVDRLAKVDHS